jgi:hypothetical protein
VTGPLASIDNQQLLGRSGTSEHDLGLGDPLLEEGTLVGIIVIQFFILESLLGESITVDNNTSRVFHGLLSRDATLDHLGVLGLGVLDDVDLFGNGGSSWGLITSDHDNLDTSRAALVDGKIDLGARRIIQGDNTDKGEVMHGESTGSARVVSPGASEGLAEGLPALHVELVVGLVELISGKVVLSESEDTLTKLTEVSVGLVDLISQVLIEIDLLTVDKDLGASGENSLGRTLHEDGEVSTILRHVTDEHVEFDVGRERNGTVDLFLRVSDGVLVGGVIFTSIFEVLDGVGELNETGLRSITLAESLDVGHLLLSNSKTSLHLLALSFSEIRDSRDGHTMDTSVELLGIIIRGVVLEEGGSAEDESHKKLVESGFLRVVAGDDLVIGLLLLLVLQVSLPVEGSIDLFSVEEHVRDSHAVLSKSTSLIRADARGGAEGLDRLEVLDEDHLIGHTSGSDSKRHSDGGKKTLGHIGDNDTDSEDHAINDDESAEGNAEEHDTEDKGNTRDDMHESLDFVGERGLLDLSLGGKVGNGTNDSVVTSLDADTETLTLSALSTEEASVVGFHDEFVGLFLRLHENLKGLTSEGSVIDLHLVGLEDDDIARDVLATLELDEVTRHHVSSLNLSGSAVSNDRTHGRDEVLELSHHLSGLGGLHVGEDTSGKGDTGEYTTQEEVILGGLVFLDSIGNETEDGTEPQKEREETSQLLGEEAVPRKLFLFLELIEAIRFKGFSNCGIGQTLFLIGVVSLAESIDTDSVVVPETKSLSLLEGLRHAALFLFFGHLFMQIYWQK